jgi:hypothetical protein
MTFSDRVGTSSCCREQSRKFVTKEGRGISIERVTTVSIDIPLRTFYVSSSLNNRISRTESVMIANMWRKLSMLP